VVPLKDVHGDVAAGGHNPETVMSLKPPVNEGVSSIMKSEVFYARPLPGRLKGSLKSVAKCLPMVREYPDTGQAPGHGLEHLYHLLA